ncbi:MAG: DUF4179 domain-containing protein [Blautia sp.]|nr:DUF4179 domain-containing protein [Lachnoclostridium sp.]MCM1209981.1 DUF4179 domain-containing protein [Blautia sp.]
MMNENHNDTGLYEILHFTPKTTPKIQANIDNAYTQIQNHTVVQRSRKCIRTVYYLSIAATLILILGFIGFSNPVLADKIPFIGKIFQAVEKNVDYPGNFSEHAVPIITPDVPPVSDFAADEYSQNTGDVTNGYSQSADGITNGYSQSAGGITITLSEASYTEMALYFSLELYSEEGFPEDFNRVQNMKDYTLPYDMLYMQCSQNFECSDPDLSSAEGLLTPYYIQGNYSDAHTFLGIVRIDLETIRKVLEIDALPTEFTYSFTIQQFWGSLNEYKEVPLTFDDTGETIIMQQPVKKYYDGPWSFKIPVSLYQTDTQSVEIMQANEDGIGISTVTKTRYEIKADIILPENVDPVDYIIAITDADGKILDSQGTMAEIYSVYGRNTDTVHIYVVDYYTFMDECKAENAYLLPEKALFQTTVEW